MTTIADSADRFSYNDVSFLVYSSSIRSVPRYSDSERTVVAVKHAIRFVAYVNDGAGETTDSTLETIRRKMMRPGGQLRYSEKGFGLFKVNIGDVKDISWGPKPKLLQFTPIGDSQTALVTWEIELEVAECPATARYTGVAALEYKTFTEFDTDGYLTMNTSGYIEIAMTRSSVNSTTVDDHVDKYRELCFGPVSLGFQRTKQSFEPSLDKRRGDFSYTDEQLPTALPRRATKFDVRQKIRSGVRRANGGGYAIWRGDISGTITMAAGASKAEAYSIFMRLVADRLSGAGAAAPPAGPAIPGIGNVFSLGNMINWLDVGGGAGRTIWTWVTAIEIDDEVAGRSTYFRAEYETFLLTTVANQFASAISKTRMWRPVPDTSYVQWRISMDDLVNRPRGAAGYQAGRDAIIDLCTPDTNDPPVEVITLHIVDDTVPNSKSLAALSDSPRLRSPRPEASWVLYENDLVYEETGHRFARSKPMGGTVTETNNIDALSRYENIRRSTESVQASGRPSVKDRLHEVASPSPKITMSGRAIRLGHPIPRPKLISVAGEIPKENRVVNFTQRIVSRYASIPVYAATWTVEYLLECAPNAPLPVSANPVSGMP